MRGVLESFESVERIRHLLGENVLVLGRAVYRPSGSVLRIDARAIELGEGQPAIWEKIPPPRGERPIIQRAKAGEVRRAIDSFFGTWPGDESDEELLAMLRELRGRSG